jgi:hypothetical protein
MSKFDRTDEVVAASMAKFVALGIEVTQNAIIEYAKTPDGQLVTTESGEPVVESSWTIWKSAKDQTGSDGKTYAAGKILKGAAYHEPYFGALSPKDAAEPVLASGADASQEQSPAPANAAEPVQADISEVLNNPTSTIAELAEAIGSLSETTDTSVDNTTVDVTATVPESETLTVNDGSEVASVTEPTGENDNGEVSEPSSNS